MAVPNRRKAVVAIPVVQPLLDRLAENDVTHIPGARYDEQAFRQSLADAEGLLVSSHVQGRPGRDRVGTEAPGDQHDERRVRPHRRRTPHVNGESSSRSRRY